jgi:hypothetical protein
MKAKRLLIACAGIAGVVGGFAAWLRPGSKLTPEERERKRRLFVNSHGRTGNATIRDFHEGVVGYTYWVGGSEYTAFQDVSSLIDLLPADPDTLIERPATLKYIASNPANSIVVCEEWSGLRFRPQVTAP